MEAAFSLWPTTTSAPFPTLREAQKTPFHLCPRQPKTMSIPKKRPSRKTTDPPLQLQREELPVQFGRTPPELRKHLPPADRPTGVHHGPHFSAPRRHGCDAPCVARPRPCPESSQQRHPGLFVCHALQACGGRSVAAELFTAEGVCFAHVKKIRKMCCYLDSCDDISWPRCSP